MPTDQRADDSGHAFYRIHDEGLSRFLPTTWGRAHAWFFVVFLVATFGPMFHLFATSTRLVWGIPVTIGWILGWMVLETAALIALYFTTVRGTAEAIEEREGVVEEPRDPMDALIDPATSELDQPTEGAR